MANDPFRKNVPDPGFGPMPTLLDTPAEDLLPGLVPLVPGLALRTLRRIQAAVFRNHGAYPAALPEISPALLARLAAASPLPALRLLDRRTSPRDGFSKLLLRNPDAPGDFEAVSIPILRGRGEPKTVACVSSQSGCAQGCRFCCTGRLGLARSLQPWEIIAQVLAVRDTAPAPLRGVVFMGMGEPLENLDAVLAAVRILASPCALAISAKAISVSTAGIVPGILRLAGAGTPPVRLFVTLFSARPEVRDRWMPVSRRYPLPALRDALPRYHLATGRRPTLAWPLVAGVNDTPEDAIALARWLDGLPAALDLIDVNDPTLSLRPPTDAARNAFLDALRLHARLPVTRRYSGGADILAACGLLSASATPAGRTVLNP